MTTIMLNRDFLYGPPSDYFSRLDLSENSNSSEEMHQSDMMRKNWETTRTAMSNLEQERQYQQNTVDQQRPRYFRCKACAFITTTKEEFWDHSRIHIRPMRMLTCPKCPFVTEFKHHLEYHIRNHLGSKPFKCDKCSYTCVNNSMLKSHMKSHSNVYQYRCANCEYATKYLHSLKIHLRRFQHQPGKVLNADGTPNPLPVVDVYGSRRGPKLQPTKLQEENQADAMSYMMKMLYTHMISSQMNTPNAMNITHGINGLPPNMTTVMAAIAGNQLPAGFSPDNSSFFNDQAVKNAMRFRAWLTYVKAMQGEPIPNESLVNNIPEVNCIQDNHQNVNIPSINQSIPKYEDDYREEQIAPLDLRKPYSNSQQKQIFEICAKATGSSKRKGKAVRLDTEGMVVQSDDEQMVFLF
ncbi:protein hunchback-like [Belonocnema kinseyi]|uniref:protein hunchback-like n=1 Tax=Belonocnema kinseyi TaxID=2817044 RepID=UPI00143DF0ED|nr:protein hunchback-like [Belonocnema kinseyi]